MSQSALSLPLGSSVATVFAAMGMRGLREWGVVDRAGGANAAPLINQAITDTAASGDVLLIPSGVYRLDGPIYARTGATVVCSPQAVLLRNFSQSGTTGLLMNPDIATALSAVRWSGGIIRNAAPASLAGNAVCLNADDSLIEKIVIDEWSSSGRAFLLFGNRLVLRRFRAVSVNDGGGVRFAGGDDFRCSDGYAECGDDTFQFVPAASTGAAQFDRSIRNGQYANCHGYSFNARLMAVALVSPTEALHMTASITDCAFIGVRGRGRQFAAVDNSDSTGSIARIDFVSTRCDSTGRSGAPVGSFWINRASGAGPVEDIRAEMISVMAPEKSALEVNGASGYPVGKVTIDKSYLDASRSAPLETVTTQYAESPTIVRSTIKGAGADPVLIGAGSGTVTDAVIEGNRIIQIDNGMSGVRFNAAAGGLVRSNAFVERSGQTTARAVTVASTATGITIQSNDYAGLTQAQKIFLTGTGNAGQRLINSGLTTSNGTTLRAHESGQTRANGSASTLQTYTLPAAVQGQRFTFAVTGTGMMAIACNGTETIRQAGSVTTPTTGRLTSTARGDAVTIEAVDSTGWQVTSVIGSWTVT